MKKMYLNYVIDENECLVNLVERDEFYTNQDEDHVDFDLFSENLKKSLENEFKISFMMVSIDDHRSFVTRNNSEIDDCDIDEFISDYLEDQENVPWKIDAYIECLKRANSRVNPYLYIRCPGSNENDFHECFRTCIGSSECSSYQDGKSKFQ